LPRTVARGRGGRATGYDGSLTGSDVGGGDWRRSADRGGRGRAKCWGLDDGKAAVAVFRQWPLYGSLFARLDCRSIRG
jgi:hypothetical protein